MTPQRGKKTAPTNRFFVVDPNRCTGCGACMVACATENAHRQGLNWRQVVTFNETRYPRIPLFHLSMACNHCLSPACLTACPASAYSKDSETGAVLPNPDHCLGCKYCTWACPYDAPQYNAAKGVIEKCDFCNDRLKKGDAPACVTACPVGALRINDPTENRFADTDPHPIEGFTNAGIRPAIRFKPLRSQQRVPEQTAPPASASGLQLFESSFRPPEKKITLQSEWTLVAFTSIAFILVALLTASVSGIFSLNPLVFLAAGGVAMAMSSIHLGKKHRAYRAVFHVASSWLSREIVFFSAFLMLALVWMQFLPGSMLLGWSAVGMGFIGLFAVDRIYQVAMKTGPLTIHSAHTLFNGLFLASALTGNLLLFGTSGILKLVLYEYRKLIFMKQHRNPRFMAGIVRILLGFGIPSLILICYPDLIPLSKHGKITASGLDVFSDVCLYVCLIVSILIGEMIDRIEYYDELDIVTPRKQMLIDLEAMRSKKTF
ncbi:MAG: DmsC/YnfH family molybdoenzyme membrane anchor subunit [Candidatus Omnitrophota bacterium]